MDTIDTWKDETTHSDCFLLLLFTVTWFNLDLYGIGEHDFVGPWKLRQVSSG